MQLRKRSAKSFLLDHALDKIDQFMEPAPDHSVSQIQSNGFVDISLSANVGSDYTNPWAGGLPETSRQLSRSSFETNPYVDVVSGRTPDAAYETCFEGFSVREEQSLRTQDILEFYSARIQAFGFSMADLSQSLKHLLHSKC